MRYFLHFVTEKRFIRDPEGNEFSGIAEAEAEAIQSARNLISEELKCGRLIPTDWRMLIATDDDTILKTIPFFAVAHGGGGTQTPELQHSHSGPRRENLNGERVHPSLSETDSGLIADAKATRAHARTTSAE